MPTSDPGFILPAASGAPLDIAGVRDGIKLQRLGGKFHYFAELTSTNDYARELAENGAGEGEVVIAESQTQGRGRLGRRWESPSLANLYLSVILRPTLAPAHAAQITLMAGVALADTVGALIQQRPTIKWPNDILVEGKKLAGVLTEAACAPDRVEYVILGIGVNVNYWIDAMPPEIRLRATSIAAVTRVAVERESVLLRLIQALDRCYGELEESGFEALRPLWESYFGLRGRRVRVESPDAVLTGRACGIRQDGALIVEDEQGALQSIYAGDVIALET
ncbi:MAG TPA: biotin--[acetyl-CoA-carboxylase] ligase [Candidatus Binatia bacterium]|jgi:BirA family biotin operon repressor/biotin-[acetyl-CoA-carboxylase] ligase